MNEVLNSLSENLKNQLNNLYQDYKAKFDDKENESYLEQILIFIRGAFKGALVNTNIDQQEWDLYDYVSDVEEQCIEKLNNRTEPSSIEEFKQEVSGYINACEKEAEELIDQLGEKIEIQI